MNLSWYLTLLAAHAAQLSAAYDEDVETSHCVDLLQTASELRTRPRLAGSRAYRQELRNLDDAAYVAEIQVGQQNFDAILDSGSFELVIFTRDCAGCGMAGHQGYDPKRSQTFAKGRLVQELSYGSGDALCSNAFDRLDIGPEENGLHVERQPIWLVEKAQMEILENSRFQAILGIGPPTAVKQQAKNDLEYLQSLDNKLKDWNVTVPASIKSHMKSKKTADFLLGNLDDNVPENLQLQFLSICLRAASGSKGVAVWHDADPRHRSPFKRLAVIGKITWGLSLKNVHLVSKGQRIPIACADGCGAVLDTGTSLITAPSDAVKKMGQVLQALGANCLQEHSLPHLEFQLGGETLSLPPAAFIGFVKGIMPAPWRLRFHQEPFIQVEDCELLMMDTGKMTSTEHGPLWIIGMPFFRHFYTTFDYGSSDHETSIWVAEASPDCQPQETTTNLLQVAGTSLLRVNQSKLRLPGWLVNGKTMPF